MHAQILIMLPDACIARFLESRGLMQSVDVLTVSRTCLLWDDEALVAAGQQDGHWAICTVQLRLGAAVWRPSKDKRPYSLADKPLQARKVDSVSRVLCGASRRAEYMRPQEGGKCVM